MLMRLLACALLLIPAAAEAQFQGCRQISSGVDVSQACIILSSTNVLDPNGNKLAAGKFILTVTNSGGTPVSYTPLGGSSTSQAFVGQIINGQVQNIAGFPFTIVNTLNASPSGLVFHYQLESSDGSQLYQDYPLWSLTSPTGGTSLDTFQALSTQVISGLGYPRTLCSGGAKYNQSDAPGGAKPWICSVLWRSDGSTHWTQNPSSNTQCPYGQALVQPRVGNFYCILPENAFALPGEGFVNPSTTAPGPISIQPLAAGGGSSHAPAKSIQVAGATAGSFDSDSAFAIDPVTHTRSSTGNDTVNAASSVPRAVYDPVDTKFLGGLAAAVAGTSGHTPTEVINAALDYGYCQTKTTNAKAAWVILPPWTILVDGVKMWTQQRLSGESMAMQSYFGHSPVTQPMVSLHGASDTITCNGTPYTPGTPVNDEVSYIAISGAFTGAQDFGIDVFGFSAYVHDIQSWGVAFGQQAVWVQGTSSEGRRLGFPGSQIEGCKDFINGISTGSCYSVQLDNLDGHSGDIYASNGAETLSGKGPGPCYPNCGAVGLNGANSTATNIFAQLSDIGIAVNANVRGDHWRVDATSMEGVRIPATGSSDGINDVTIGAPCLSATLQAAYNAHTPTGCAGINSTNAQGGGSVWTMISAGPNAFFGSSYMQCGVLDAANSGSGSSNVWGFITAQGTPGNLTPNDWAICGSNSAGSSLRAVFYNVGTPVFANTATININAISSLWIGNGTTVTNFIGGNSGQRVTISAGPNQTATLAVSGNFRSCSGLPIAISNQNPIDAIVNAFSGNLEMVCNPPNPTPWHVNYFGNAAPSAPSLQSVYGNTQSLAVPAFTNDASQIHGPAAGSGHYCFEEEHVYPDNSHVVTAKFCTTVDLTAQTPGEIFAVNSPQVTQDNLYLTDNTTGSGLSLGKYPAPSGGFWDGPTTIAAGGDGSTPPAETENTTGSAYLDFGIKGPAVAPSGTCTAAQGGTTVISRDGHGTHCPTGGGTWTTKW